MTDQPPDSSGSRRFLLTVGEIVAVLGLGLAALNYWDSRHDRIVDDKAKTQAQVQAQTQEKVEAAKASAFIVRGEVDNDGARIFLTPLKSEQAIQTERYVFPKLVLNHPMEIDAGKPQIDLAWFDDGLRDQLKAAHKAGADYPEGEAELPVGVTTTYIDQGETRTDTAIYRVGYSVSKSLLGGLKLHLQGLSLVRRDVSGDLQASVDAMWAASAPKPPVKPTP